MAIVVRLDFEYYSDTLTLIVIILTIMMI